MAKGLKSYNKLMFHLAMEYDTIGTIYTENPEMRNNWNLRDMVSEVQYILDFYNEPDTVFSEMAESDDPEDRKRWRDDCSRMKRFIARYKDEALTMECTSGHCSKFD